MFFHLYPPSVPPDRQAAVPPRRRASRLPRRRAGSSLRRRACTQSPWDPSSRSAFVPARLPSPATAAPLPFSRQKLSLLVLLVLLLPAAGNATDAPPVGGGCGGFNVTKMLDKFPEFTLFNYLMANTRVAKDINNRTSITVLAPVNADVDWLLCRIAHLPRAALLELLSVHVVIDYYDAAKLTALPRGRVAKAVLATTLYQTFGPANDDNSGFLIITPAPDGGAVFASTAPGRSSTPPSPPGPRTVLNFSHVDQPCHNLV